MLVRTVKSCLGMLGVWGGGCVPEPLILEKL